MKAIEDHLGIHPGQTTADGLFTFTEVECLGACVNAPMVQINDDYFEDLTPETTVELLKALQASAEATGLSAGPAGLGGESTEGTGSQSGEDRGQTGANVTSGGRRYVAKGVQVPSSGPMTGRKTCENSKGLTSLTGEPWNSADMMRTDGAL
ncbi:MAG: hypothetical protein MMC23_005836 [Stictis urceolatum]|nr:hypothetical protein [Stictis urceolata]